MAGRRHRTAAPELALRADLTPRPLDAFGEKASLEVATVVRRVLDQELGEWDGRLVQRRAPYRVLIEVVGTNAPERDVLLDRPVISARRAQMELAQGLAVREGIRDRRA